ncbi:hemerythrin domain-containing protein [Methanosarcina sp.]|uniref:hemerythrin domain-containing protein n=1 Tax=Methanosarcina sp. TaxID=2213 RepID=UPI003C76DD21
MKPTDDLREEHKAVKLMLEILDGICTNIESGRSVKQEYLDGLVEFMRIFVDKCHHTKEELYLFPEMEKAGISGSRELIISLKKEHEQGRQHVNRIEEAVSGKEGNRGLPAIVENSRAYIQLLTPHIEKENNKLFPMADTYLSETTQNDLLEHFEAVETEIIGPGKHEEFHRWLHTLGERYKKPA